MLVKAQMFYLEQKLGRLSNRGLRSFFNSERGRKLEFNSVLPTEKSVLLFPGVFQAVLGFFVTEAGSQASVLTGGGDPTRRQT